MLSNWPSCVLLPTQGGCLAQKRSLSHVFTQPPPLSTAPYFLQGCNICLPQSLCCGWSCKGVGGQGRCQKMINSAWIPRTRSQAAQALQLLRKWNLGTAGVLGR